MNTDPTMPTMNGAASRAPDSNMTAAPKPAATSTALAVPEDTGGGAIAAFASARNFEAAQRMAKALASSTLVPAAYQNNLPNVLIAMEMASRIGASVFMVMQSLDIVHGRPSWRAQFLIATVNASGRFTPLRFQFEGTRGSDEWGCRAVAKDRASGEECTGPLVTIKMAKDEGWHGKNGSKWKTMPELMLMYRAGGFWTRVYAPELSLGMSTAEEVIDTTGIAIQDAPRVPPSVGSARDLEADMLADAPAQAPIIEAQPIESPKATRAKRSAVPHDPTTGEVPPEFEPREPGEEG